MTQYKRGGSLATLIFAIVVGLTAMAVGGVFQTRRGSQSIAELEARIAAGRGGNAATWIAYADALRADNRFSAAARAYDHAADAANREGLDSSALRFNGALCVGQSSDAEKFFPLITRLTAADPKAAMNLLERPELAPLHNDPRWAPALKSARAQAAD